MASRAEGRVRTAGLLCAVLGALGFSFKAIFVKAAYRYGVDAETLLALRMGYAFPLFAIMAWSVNQRQPLRLTGRDWRELALLGIIGYYLSSYLDFLGLRYISAALERIILFIHPTLVVVLSAAFLGKPLTRRTLLLLALCYVGVALSVAGDLRVTTKGVAIGSALVFASALSYAIYLMRSGEAVLRLGATRVTAYATGIACILCLAQFALLRPVAALDQPWPVQLLALCMAVFSTVLPIWLFTEAIRLLGAGTASMIGSLGPVFTIMLAAVVLGEPLGIMAVAGALLVMLAVSRLAQR